ncbi:MAG: hypothetical protein AAGJ28_02325 [Pseudomonadota bacterium]
MNRRRALMFLAAGTAVAVPAAGAVATFRLHRPVRRVPYLTDAHLTGLSMPAAGQGPRVLFVGNSMLLRHDVPGRVAALAAKQGRAIRPALAAGQGVRLVEVMRVAAFRDLLRPGLWDAAVLQDFTKTPLRAVDRWASSWAMGAIAERLRGVPLLLAPPWPGAPENSVYRDAGWLTAAPVDAADYARRTMLHYEATAAEIGAQVAPVPATWAAALATGIPVFDADGHHASPEGADVLAGVLWDQLQKML